MASGENPLRLRSNYSSTSCTSQSIVHRPPGRSHDKPTTPSYRLFPTVEPSTPRTPTSVVTLQEKPLTRAKERSRRRSSLDDLAKIVAPRQNAPVLKLVTNTGRRDSKNNVRPMSVAHDSIVDSPTVPGWLGDLPRSSDENSHGRSSSAPGEFIRDSQTLPGQSVQSRDVRSKLGWRSRQADAVNKGLGLSLQQNNTSTQQPARKGLASRRPDLTIAIKKDDEPPPPPPKSPRHSQTSSAQSPVPSIPSSPISSIHDSPTDGVVATPGSILRAALVDAQGSPVRTPPTHHATKTSYFPPPGSIRVRQFAGSKDLERPSQPQAPGQSADRLPISKPTKPNVDKPMPRLPASSSFSDHIREVRAAEGADHDKTPKAEPSASNAKTTAPSEATSTTQTASLDQRRDRSESAGSSATKKAPLKAVNQDVARAVRTPTPDQGDQIQPVASTLQQTSAGGKSTALLPPELASRSVSPEPRILPKISESSTDTTDPLQTLETLSKQTEALHTRYATLRADRLKLSTSISSSLKDHKPGPEYASSLLDKHFEINAINSSIDICFAKLKSLDCRKEEAIALIVAQSKARVVTGHVRKTSSTGSHVTNPSLADSAICTPDMGAAEFKSETSELRSGAAFSSAPKAAEPAVKQSFETIKEAKASPPIPDRPAPVPAETGRSASPQTAEDARTTPKPEISDQDNSPPTERRQTAIRVSPLPTPIPNLPPEPDQLSPVSPVSPISSFEEKPKRIRVKGVKAAKILGLVAQSANGVQADGSAITLPDEPLLRWATPSTKPTTVEVEIHRKPVPKRTKAPHIAAMMSPTRTTAPPPPRKGTNDSMTSLTSNSQAESSPELFEATTPPGSPKTPHGSRGVKKGGSVKTIQVVVDDDILDYYKGSERW